MDKIQAAAMNKVLATRYGSYGGQPLFRLVWSSDRFEVRKTLAPYTSHGIDFGEVEAERTMPVYNYAPDRWVLEVLLGKADLPPEFVSAKQLDYWGIWVFHDTKVEVSDGWAPTEPTLEDIDRMVHFARHGTLKGHRPTEAQIDAAFEQRQKRFRDNLREKLDNEIPDLPHALVHGSAVVVPADTRADDSVIVEKMEKAK